METPVARIAETDEQKCSRRCTVVTIRIATGDASTAGLASVPKRGQYDGAALSEVAGTTPIAERMGESADISSAGEV
jgi:hypothetical protein